LVFSAQLNEEEDRFLEFVLSILNNQHMYFSHDYDLSHSFQRIVQMNADPQRAKVFAIDVILIFVFLTWLIHLPFSDANLWSSGRAFLLQSVLSCTRLIFVLTLLSFHCLSLSLCSFLMQPLIERNLNDWILPLVSGNVVMASFSAKVPECPFVILL
jgi:hypothetical protein